MTHETQPARPERLYAATARRVAELIREEGLGPGDRLPTEAELARRLGVSRATVREAFVALEMAGVVEVRLNAGAVALAPERAVGAARSPTLAERDRLLGAALDGSDLREVAKFRILIEADGARRAIAAGGVGWESALVAAHHRLAHIESRMHRNGGADFDLWRQCDWEFHAALLSACGSALHQRIHKAMFDQFRRVVQAEFKAVGFRGRRIIEEHKAILDAALTRDADACAAALDAHISVYFREGGGAKRAPKARRKVAKTGPRAR